MTDKQPQPQGDAAMPVVAMAGPGEAGGNRFISEPTFRPRAPVDLVCQSDAQAAIAARDAEIEQLKKEAKHYWAAAQEEASEVDRLRSLAAPEAAQPADTEAQVQEVMRLVRGLLGPDAWHGPWASVTSDALAAVESAIRRLVGWK
jgi:hypothetical protein